MAVTIPHGGQHHTASPKDRPPQHHGAPPHAHPHAHPHHPHPPPGVKRGGGVGKIILFAGLLLAAIAGALITFADRGDGLTSEERLLRQMHEAATGAVASPHTFNGELSVTRNDQGGLNVVAKGLPPKACVSVAWRLAREGTVIVNGTMPMRISAGRLTELCADEQGDGSTLTWVPEQQ